MPTESSRTDSLNLSQPPRKLLAIAAGMVMSLNVFMPSESVPIKILSTVERVLPNPGGTEGESDTHFVLNFREISEDHHRRIVKFIVSLYLRKPSR